MALASFLARPSLMKPDSVSMTATGICLLPIRLASSMASVTGLVPLFRGLVALPSVMRMTTGSWFASWR